MEKFIPSKEYKSYYKIFKGSYSQSMERMWKILYDDGRRPVYERETFYESYIIKDKEDFRCSEWYSLDGYRHGDSYDLNILRPGWKRTQSYIMKIKSPIGPNKTNTELTEEIIHFDPELIVIKNISSTPDVPYGKSFNTVLITCLINEDDKYVKVEVYGYIKWIKGCLLKKTIEKMAIQGMIDHQNEEDKALKNYLFENPYYDIKLSTSGNIQKQDQSQNTEKKLEVKQCKDNKNELNSSSKIINEEKQLLKKYENEKNKIIQNKKSRFLNRFFMTFIFLVIFIAIYLIIKKFILYQEQIKQLYIQINNLKKEIVMNEKINE